MKKNRKILQSLIRLLSLVIFTSLYITAFSQPGTIKGDWNTQASSYRGRNGDRITFYFPPGGTVSERVWGTELYTDDGSIASCAVHAGLITTTKGGTVTIEIKPGASAYRGTYRNGVTSKDYGAFSGSFIFVAGHRNEAGKNAIRGDWNTKANNFRGRNGERFTYYFPPGGTLSGSIWGTDLYTDDGSIATCAVHAGLISVENGGTVTIEIKPGASVYRGTTRYGVSSRNYGAFNGSFVFVKGQENIIPKHNKVTEGNWETRADTYRGRNGDHFTFYFPPGGPLSSRVWGTGLYSDDSSIASCAVHAGLITVESGGTVTIEIKQGASSYRGSYRNGVTSRDYGAFAGSFVFVR